MSGRAAAIRQWFACNRSRLSGRGNWFQGSEPNTMPAAAAESAAVRVLIARLSAYADVARGITHSFLYQLAASVPGCFADMAFFPGDADEKLFRSHDIPLWTGTTTKMPAAEFDIVAISNSVLQELVNLPAALHYSGISLHEKERIEKKSPLVIIGGSNSYNLSILHQIDGAGLVDAVIVGDGEEAFTALLRLVIDNRHLPRFELLELLADKVPGFYRPGRFVQRFSPDGKLAAVELKAGKAVKAARAEVDAPIFSGGPLLYDEEAAGASHLLITNGCPSFCSFCKESWEQKPYREKGYDRVLEAALQLKARMGLSEVALMSFNATTYTHVFGLVRELDRVFARVSLKSQRFDTVFNAPELLELQFDAGKRTFTCAMEGISDRLRALLQKNLDEKMILDGIARLVQLNMRSLKVFLILTGYESEADVEEFTAFLEKIKHLFSEAQGRANVVFSFACLFRPPHTPLQFAGPRQSRREFDAMLLRLVALIEKSGFSARISAGPADAIVSEFIAYADRRYLPLLIAASVNADFRYRGEVPLALLNYFEEETRKAKLPFPAPGGTGPEAVFPWDDIDTGIDKTFLFNNFCRLENGSEMTACIAKPFGCGVCNGCGACRSADEIKRVTGCGPVAALAPSLPHRPRPVNVRLRFVIPRIWTWCGPQFIRAALARRFMLDNPALVQDFIRVSRVEPELFGWGDAAAEIELSARPEKLEFSASDLENDIGIIAEVDRRCQWPAGLWPLVLAAEITDPEPDFARSIDAILQRYRLKHQKVRNQTVISWAVNKGEARSSGITRLNFNEQTGEFRLELQKMPDLHLLNLFTGSACLRIELSRR